MRSTLLSVLFCVQASCTRTVRSATEDAAVRDARPPTTADAADVWSAPRECLGSPMRESPVAPGNPCLTYTLMDSCRDWARSLVSDAGLSSYSICVSEPDSGFGTCVRATGCAGRYTPGNAGIVGLLSTCRCGTDLACGPREYCAEIVPGVEYRCRCIPPAATR